MLAQKRAKKKKGFPLPGWLTGGTSVNVEIFIIILIRSQLKASFLWTLLDCSASQSSVNVGINWGLVKMQTSIQWLLGEACDPVFLTTSQFMFYQQHFEQQGPKRPYERIVLIIP